MKTSIPSILCIVSLPFLISATVLRAAEEQAVSESSSADPIAEISDEISHVEGEVTIPYVEMKRLWEALREKSKQPEKERTPINFVVESAGYELRVSDSKSHLTVDYRIQVFSDEWQTIPLIGGEVSLEEVESEKGSIVRKDDFYALMVKGQASLRNREDGKGVVAELVLPAE